MIHTSVKSAVKELLKIGGQLDKAAEFTSFFGGKIVQDNVTNELQKIGLQSSSELMKSITRQSNVSLTSLNYSTSVTSDQEYANVIETGRRPNQKAPPPDRILKWMTIVGREPTAEGAYLIGQKIARDGIQGKHPFEKAALRSDPEVFRFANIQVEKALTSFGLTSGEFNTAEGIFNVEIPTE